MKQLLLIYFYDKNGTFNRRQAVRGSTMNIVNWANRQIIMHDYGSFDMKEEYINVPSNWIVNV